MNRNFFSQPSYPGTGGQMVPRLGEKYGIEVEIISKPRETYQSDEYARFGLPAASTIMIGDEIIVQSSDIGEEQLDAAILRRLAQYGKEGKEGCGLLSGG